MREIWTTAFSKELGGLAQGDNKTGAKGTNTVFFMNHNEIRNIPTGRTVTYARVVVDYRPQIDDPNRVRITVDGNLINRNVMVKTLNSLYLPTIHHASTNLASLEFNKLLDPSYTMPDVSTSLYS